MLDNPDEVLKAPMLLCLNAMNATLTLNANLTLNAMDANLTLLNTMNDNLTLLNITNANLTLLNITNANLTLLNTMNANLTLLNTLNANVTLNVMNTNLTMNATNANLTLVNAMNASSIEHRSVNSKVIDLNTKIISTDNKVTSVNAKVVTAKSNTYNCVNDKSIYDAKHFQACANNNTITVRSRYVKFLCAKNPQSQLMFIRNYQHNNCLSRQHRREREPSRIPAKKICCLLTKSRKLRKAFRRKVKRDIPDSSCIYRYTQAFSHECQRVLSCKCFYQFIKTKLNWKTPFLKKPKKEAIELRHLKFNCKVDKKKRQQFYNINFGKTEKTTFKDLNHKHKVNCSKLILCGDIETNPGPAFNNPVKTIHAPYSQGNTEIFGENAGRQCVPMSLCSLIYWYRNNSICVSSDLVNIMNLGNQLYSTLSRLSRQMYLLLEELPTMVTVEDTDYSIELSQSYNGNLHLPVMSESVPFVMPLDSALQQLQQETFHLFLLTIEYNTVSIITESNGIIKVFDSHARDSFGMPHPHGTCVLLEFDSVRNLIEYFKFLYRPDVIYEMKGVKINYLCSDLLENYDTNVISHDNTNSNTSLHSTTTVALETVDDNSIFSTQKYFIFIYSICFSTIKRCNYWNYQTENAIVEHAVELFDETSNQTHLSTDLPESIRICDSTIKVTYASRHEGELCVSSEVSKAALAELIFANTVHNTEFLIRLGNLALACITENNMSVKKENQRTKYFIVSPDETRELNLFKPLPNSHSVVGRLCDILNLNEPDLDKVEYILQFLSIPSVLPKLERQRVLRKHKSNDQQNTVRENKRNNYKSMSPVQKQLKLQRNEPNKKASSP